MIIEFKLNTDLLKALDINLKQLLFIDMLYRNTGVMKVKAFLKAGILDEGDFESLIEKGILLETSNKDIPNTIDFKKGMRANYEAFGKNDDYFDEFALTYPDMALRPDGTNQFLKANLRQARAAYNKVVENNIEMHERLCNALKKDVRHKEMTGSSGFMKTIINWIRSEEWLVAERRDTPLTSKNNQSYGTKFL